MKLIFKIPLKVPGGTLNGTLKDKYCPCLKMYLYNIAGDCREDKRLKENNKAPYESSC
jgi:hypothetical protein